MVEATSLRRRLPDLWERLREHPHLQQSLVGRWTSDGACLVALVEMAIACRSAGDWKTSLMLLVWLREQGVNHPLVVDNQIRGLIDSDRFAEASLLLPALAELDQGEILQGATDALLIHQETLLSNIRRHGQAQPRDPVGLEFLEGIPPDQLQERLLTFALRQIEAGGAALAKAVLLELMQWGEGSLDALPRDLQQRWAGLVVLLGEQVWQDLPSYRDALDQLQGADDVNLRWQRLEVELMQLQDIGDGAAALTSALQFLMQSPGHDAARAWLAEQHRGVLQQGLPNAGADQVLAVDQSLFRDVLILGHLRKLVDPVAFSC